MPYMGCAQENFLRDAFATYRGLLSKASALTRRAFSPRKMLGHSVTE